jgi:hypothetical protein
VNIQRALSSSIVLSVFLSTLASPVLATNTTKPTSAPSSSDLKQTAASTAHSKRATANTTGSKDQAVKPWLKSKTFKHTTIRKGRFVTVEYPQFIGEPKESVATLNKLMKKFVNGHMPALKINADPNPNDFVYSCGYQVTSLSPDLISIDMDFYSFTGGAHGNTVTAPFNYRLTNNGPKEITLANVFGKKPDLKTLQTLVRPRLLEELYPDDDGADREWINTGTADLSCFQCISIDKDGLTFNFQQYQVACYADGAPSITVSYTELKDMFTPTSPIYSIVKAATHESSTLTKTANRQTFDTFYRSHR